MPPWAQGYKGSADNLVSGGVSNQLIADYMYQGDGTSKNVAVPVEGSEETEDGKVADRMPCPSEYEASPM